MRIRWPEQRLDQGGEADAGVAQQAAGELGVEEEVGAQAHLAQARQVLGGGVQDPLGAREGLLERGQVESNAIGSTSQVPAPSRRSWIR